MLGLGTTGVYDIFGDDVDVTGVRTVTVVTNCAVGRSSSDQ